MNKNVYNQFPNFDDIDTNFKGQSKRYYWAIYYTPMTMLEASEALGIRRANICRFVDDFKKKGLITVTGIRRCTITRHPFVQELSTNPDLFLFDNQLKLF